MTTVDEEDRVRKALLEHAARFFKDVRDKRQLFLRNAHAFKQLMTEMGALADAGKLTHEAAAAWSWYSCVAPAIVYIALIEDDVAWGTAEIEAQVLEAFRKVLAGSQSRSVSAVDEDADDNPIPRVLRPPSSDPSH